MSKSSVCYSRGKLLLIQMQRTQRYLFLCLISCLMAGNAIAEPSYSVGFRAIEANQEEGISGGIWYPSTDEEFVKKWGPFRPSWAWNGKAAIGHFPVILFSHGVGGRYRNHRDTASALARKGYVVMIPQLTKDEWIDTDKTVSVIEHRIAEFSRTLAAFSKAEPEIASIIDEQRIGAIGYSLGGLTALGSSGVIPNFDYVEEHCLKNQSLDPDFCLDVPWWQRIWFWLASTDLVHWFYGTGLTDKEVVSEVEPPIKFKAIALVAPAAAAFSPTQIQGIEGELGIFRLAKDQITRFPFHAEYVHKSLGEKTHTYKVYENAHHYAFISPFPDWLLKEESIPVGMDPDGFDRKAFLEKINNDIVAFLEDAI